MAYSGASPNDSKLPATLPVTIVSSLVAFLTIFSACETVFPRDLEAEENVVSTVQTKTIASDKIHINGIYRSMVGPWRRTKAQITDRHDGKLIWLTGAKIEVQDGKRNAMPDKYLCHSNVSFEDPLKHNRLMTHQHATPTRKFIDLNQGQPGIEFPQGFGTPFLGDERVFFDVMALNNQPLEAPIDLRFEVSLNYVVEEDLEEPMKVLRQTGIDFVVPAPHPNCHDAAEGAPCGVFYAEESGRWRNSHWLVPPGRHTFRHALGGGMFIPFNTTAHFIAMHMHPYAESMELIDQTTNETIFKGYAHHYANKQDIEKLESYSSAEGTPLYRDHQYEVITVYNNLTDRDIDAMAILYIYFWDKKFDPNEIGIGTGKTPEIFLR